MALPPGNAFSSEPAAWGPAWPLLLSTSSRADYFPTHTSKLGLRIHDLSCGMYEAEAEAQELVAAGLAEVTAASLSSSSAELCTYDDLGLDDDVSPFLGGCGFGYAEGARGDEEARRCVAAAVRALVAGSSAFVLLAAQGAAHPEAVRASVQLVVTAACPEDQRPGWQTDLASTVAKRAPGWHLAGVSVRRGSLIVHLDLVYLPPGATAQPQHDPGFLPADASGADPVPGAASGSHGLGPPAERPAMARALGSPPMPLLARAQASNVSPFGDGGWGSGLPSPGSTEGLERLWTGPVAAATSAGPASLDPAAVLGDAGEHSSERSGVSGPGAVQSLVTFLHGLGAAGVVEALGLPQRRLVAQGDVISVQYEDTMLLYDDAAESATAAAGEAGAVAAITASQLREGGEDGSVEAASPLQIGRTAFQIEEAGEGAPMPVPTAAADAAPAVAMSAAGPSPGAGRARAGAGSALQPRLEDGVEPAATAASAAELAPSRLIPAGASARDIHGAGSLRLRETGPSKAGPSYSRSDSAAAPASAATADAPQQHAAPLSSAPLLATAVLALLASVVCAGAWGPGGYAAALVVGALLLAGGLAAAAQFRRAAAAGSMRTPTDAAVCPGRGGVEEESAEVVTPRTASLLFHDDSALDHPASPRPQPHCDSPFTAPAAGAESFTLSTPASARALAPASTLNDARESAFRGAATPSISSLVPGESSVGSVVVNALLPDPWDVHVDGCALVLGRSPHARHTRSTLRLGFTCASGAVLDELKVVLRHVSPSSMATGVQGSSEAQGVTVTRRLTAAASPAASAAGGAPAAHAQTTSPPLRCAADLRMWAAPGDTPGLVFVELWRGRRRLSSQPVLLAGEEDWEEDGDETPGLGASEGAGTAAATAPATPTGPGGVSAGLSYALAWAEDVESYAAALEAEGQGQAARQFVEDLGSWLAQVAALDQGLMTPAADEAARGLAAAGAVTRVLHLRNRLAPGAGPVCAAPLPVASPRWRAPAAAPRRAASAPRAPGAAPFTGRPRRASTCVPGPSDGIGMDAGGLAASLRQLLLASGRVLLAVAVEAGCVALATMLQGLLAERPLAAGAAGALEGAATPVTCLPLLHAAVKSGRPEMVDLVASWYDGAGVQVMWAQEALVRAVALDAPGSGAPAGAIGGLLDASYTLGPQPGASQQSEGTAGLPPPSFAEFLSVAADGPQGRPGAGGEAATPEGTGGGSKKRAEPAAVMKRERLTGSFQLGTPRLAFSAVRDAVTRQPQPPSHGRPRESTFHGAAGPVAAVAMAAVPSSAQAAALLVGTDASAPPRWPFRVVSLRPSVQPGRPTNATAPVGVLLAEDAQVAATSSPGPFSSFVPHIPRTDLVEPGPADGATAVALLPLQPTTLELFASQPHASLVSRTSQTGAATATSPSNIPSSARATDMGSTALPPPGRSHHHILGSGADASACGNLAGAPGHVALADVPRAPLTAAAGSVSGYSAVGPAGGASIGCGLLDGGLLLLTPLHVALALDDEGRIATHVLSRYPEALSLFQASVSSAASALSSHHLATGPGFSWSCALASAAGAMASSVSHTTLVLGLAGAGSSHGNGATVFPMPTANTPRGTASAPTAPSPAAAGGLASAGSSIGAGTGAGAGGAARSGLGPYGSGSSAAHAAVLGCHSTASSVVSGVSLARLRPSGVSVGRRSTAGAGGGAGVEAAAAPGRSGAGAGAGPEAGRVGAGLASGGANARGVVGGGGVGRLLAATSILAENSGAWGEFGEVPGARTSTALGSARSVTGDAWEAAVKPGVVQEESQEGLCSEERGGSVVQSLTLGEQAFLDGLRWVEDETCYNCGHQDMVLRNGLAGLRDGQRAWSVKDCNSCFTTWNRDVSAANVIRILLLLKLLGFSRPAALERPPAVDPG
ncbi:hypothetical protein HYH03_006033 [Edaphochlamys debaryana]|uniref:Uncharacterized protein n=1 Tax=Edaphochlamys debaryana TaxID=47281 RepID=A0A836C0I9_9CHLO|nr:hypothetical protein HYH03_006033 [Edaphochlamys debaryana]|eukprot:KAG2495790.1 hypothetical protein HYH03_006033 [Edaphochlamys debaryana]